MSEQLTADEKRTLVKAAEDILDKVAKTKLEKSFWEQASQLRNLVQIAQQESEVPVLKNFIHYQTGRRATKAFWRPIHESVIRELEAIESRHPEQAARKLAIQSFFGYLVRHYVYLKETH
ncbi:MAG TPA: hypothetical protein VH988_34295 [Thermoanaerobaculia bacterium]|jgi:hypothetical protein|nr:hypothetical protein [Thermoanaerobaculia bacterium]